MDEPPAKRAKTLPLPLSHALVSWYDLSPELIARMSRYVDIGHDMTGLCVVVGSDVADRIRHVYLRDNDAYLSYALSLIATDTAATAASKVRSWMDANTNWRDRCDKISVENAPWTRRDFFTLSQLQTLSDTLGGRVIFNEDGPRTVLTTVTGDGEEQDYATVPVSCIFTSPVIATRLGLVEVVQTLIEQGFVGVHDFLPSNRSGNNMHVSLSCFCMDARVDNSVLRYLLSRDDFDLNAPWNRDYPRDRPVHLATRSELADAEALKLILDHPNCSVDMVSELERTPLHHLCLSSHSVEHPFKHNAFKHNAVGKMKVLLEYGANPTKIDGEGNAPFDYLVNCLRHARTEEDVHLATDLLAVLQIAIVARRNHQQDEED